MAYSFARSADPGTCAVTCASDKSTADLVEPNPARAGFVMTAADRDVELTRIMDVTCHKDVRTVTGYVRRQPVQGARGIVVPVEFSCHCAIEKPGLARPC
jgi:hypothetical protein